MRHKPDGKPLKAVLFDMDGVLLDSEPGAFRMFLDSLKVIGIEETLENMMRDYLGKPSKRIREEVLAKHHSPVTEAEFREIHHSRGSFYAVSDEVVPIDGLVKFLEGLRDSGIRMAVVSSTTSCNVLIALNRMRILKYFDAVVCSDALKEGKPSPEGYLKAAEYLEIKPAECMIIEDSSLGVEAARRAGIFVVGFKAASYGQDTSKADIEAGSYQELSKKLKVS